MDANVLLTIGAIAFVLLLILKGVSGLARENRHGDHGGGLAGYDNPVYEDASQPVDYSQYDGRGYSERPQQQYWQKYREPAQPATLLFDPETGKSIHDWQTHVNLKMQHKAESDYADTLINILAREDKKREEW